MDITEFGISTYTTSIIDSFLFIDEEYQYTFIGTEQSMSTCTRFQLQVQGHFFFHSMTDCFGRVLQLHFSILTSIFTSQCRSLLRAILWRRSFRSLSTGPYFEDSVDRDHHYLIRILSFLDTAFGGVPTDNVVADEDFMDITSPGSTASLAELAISSFPGAGGGRSVSSYKPLQGSVGGIR